MALRRVRLQCAEGVGARDMMAASVPGAPLRDGVGMAVIAAAGKSAAFAARSAFSCCALRSCFDCSPEENAAPRLLRIDLLARTIGVGGGALALLKGDLP